MTMNSMIAFGQYYDSNSWLHRLDPRTKIMSLFVLMIALFCTSNIYAIGICLVLSFVLIASAKVPLLKCLNSLKGMAALILMSAIFQILMNKQGTLLTTLNFDFTVVNILIVIILLVFYFWLGRHVKVLRISQFIVIFAIAIYLFVKVPVIHLFHENWKVDVGIYSGSLLNAGVIAGRVAVVLFLSTLLTLTTKSTDLNTGLSKILQPLKKIKLPVDTFSMMISIALRYIPTMMNETQRILKAQASRGADMGEGSFGQRVKQTTSLLVPMFVVAFDRGSDLADAMAARGYDPDHERTSLHILKFKAADIIVLVFSHVALVASIVFAII